ncbi:CinA family protein, partial [Candidatus Omnitrophota bacterium]
SAKVCRLMAQNVRRIASSQFGIGITGIAGPSGGSTEKPVGTVFICVAKKNKAVARKFRFSGSRLVVKRKTALKALSMLRNLL